MTDKLYLRRLMPIIQVPNLDCVTFPKLVLPVINGIRMFKYNDRFVTEKMLPFDGLKKLETVLPDGVDGFYSNKTLYIYDCLNPFTYLYGYLDRIKYILQEIGDVPSTEIIVPIRIATHEQFEAANFFVPSIYFREPWGLYWQKYAKDRYQLWLEYRLGTIKQGVIKEVVGDDKITALIVGDNGSDVIINMPLRVDSEYLIRYKKQLVGVTVRYNERMTDKRCTFVSLIGFKAVDNRDYEGL